MNSFNHVEYSIFNIINVLISMSTGHGIARGMVHRTSIIKIVPVNSPNISYKYVYFDAKYT